jgi:oligopeptide transport system ATP-binding protein
MSTPLLEVRELRTTFRSEGRTIRAADGVSFTLQRGECLGLVGESGSGKTVVNLSLLRLIPSPPGRIDGGEVLFDGRDLLRASEAELRALRGHRIAMIFQDPMTSLNPYLRIGDQLTEVLRLHKGHRGGEARSRAAYLLSQVGIADGAQRLDEHPHPLSGGLRQRVMIAMALACEPELLLADEPTTALDVTIQAQILELLQRLRRERGMAMILVTHALGVVASIADRIAVMYAGRIVELGSARDVLKRPAHPYTRALLGSLPRVDRPGLLHAIRGAPPDLAALGAGCAFRPRCDLAVERCAEAPPLAPVGEGVHRAACWRSGEGRE